MSLILHHDLGFLKKKTKNILELYGTLLWQPCQSLIGTVGYWLCSYLLCSGFWIAYLNLLLVPILYVHRDADINFVLKRRALWLP